MDNGKFRCHISILLEKMKGFFWALVLIAFNALQSFVSQDSREISDTQEALPWGIILAVVAGLLLLYVLYCYLVWSKTWFYVKEGSLVCERNTLNRHVNTIGIQNISNINIEQNILERILGTCKVKLDTNSLSTANENDVSIVLKLKEGKALKAYLLSVLSEGTVNELSDEENQEENLVYDVEASVGDIIRHGFLMLSPFAILSFLVSLGVIVMELRDTVFTTDFTGNILNIFVNLIAIFIILFSAAGSMLKGIFSYYGLKAKRAGNKLYLSYGFFKKTEFEIPVDKINAVEVIQPLFCRIFHRYCVEVVNVGMTDGNADAKSHLILACKKEELERQLQLLLPEIPIDLAFTIKKQPKAVLFGYIRRSLIILGCCVLGEFMIKEFVEAEIEKFSWNLLIAVTIIGISLLAVLVIVLKYYTVGSSFEKKYFSVSTGTIKKTITITNYAQVQYLTIAQSLSDRYFGICSGIFYLLADFRNQNKRFPYVEEDEIRKIRDKMCSW